MEKEDFELQEGRVIETSCTSKHRGLFYNLTMTFCSIKLMEEILLNIISKKKREINLQKPIAHFGFEHNIRIHSVPV